MQKRFSEHTELPCVPIVTELNLWTLTHSRQICIVFSRSAQLQTTLAFQWAGFGQLHSRWHYSCEVSLSLHAYLKYVICQMIITNTLCIANGKEEDFCSLLQILSCYACSLSKLHIGISLIA